MNIVLADGGLGNQLFQLAFALFLRETSGENVVVDTKTNAIRHRHGTAGLANIADALNLQQNMGPRPEYLVRLALLQRSLSTRKLLTRLAGLGSPKFSSNTRVHAGYWQNEELLGPYYTRVADACCEVLSLHPGPDTCLHIRFGDYTSTKNRKIYNQIGSKYYSTALRHLEEKTGCRRVRVLTNDFGSARKMFDANEFMGVEFVYEPGDMLTDFAAISQSASLITSNSTFCWWGSLISARLTGLTHLVAPAKWFNPNYQHRQAPSYAALPNLSKHEYNAFFFDELS